MALSLTTTPDVSVGGGATSRLLALWSRAVFQFQRRDATVTAIASNAGLLELTVSGDVTASTPAGASVYVSAIASVVPEAANTTVISSAFAAGNTKIVVAYSYISTLPTGYINFLSARPDYAIRIKLYSAYYGAQIMSTYYLTPPASGDMDFDPHPLLMNPARFANMVGNNYAGVGVVLTTHMYRWYFAWSEVYTGNTPSDTNTSTYSSVMAAMPEGETCNMSSYFFSSGILSSTGVAQWLSRFTGGAVGVPVAQAWPSIPLVFCAAGADAGSVTYQYMIRWLDATGALISSTASTIASNEGQSFYRAVYAFQLTPTSAPAGAVYAEIYTRRSGNDSQRANLALVVQIQPCDPGASMTLRWANGLGGIDQWTFLRYTDADNIDERGETITPYVSLPENQRKFGLPVKVEGAQRITLYADVNRAQLDALRWLSLSPMVVEWGGSTSAAQYSISIVSRSWVVSNIDKNRFLLSFEVERKPYNTVGQ